MLVGMGEATTTLNLNHNLNLNLNLNQLQCQLQPLILPPTTQAEIGKLLLMNFPDTPLPVTVGVSTLERSMI